MVVGIKRQTRQKNWEINLSVRGNTTLKRWNFKSAVENMDSLINGAAVVFISHDTIEENLHESEL